MGVAAVMRRLRFWKTVPLPVLTIGFLEQAAFVVLFLFLTQRYLSEDRGLGVAFAGYVITVYGLTKLVAQAPAGWLGDRIGYRTSLVIGLSASLLATTFMIGSHEAWVFLAATALYSLGKAPVGPALNATVANLYAEESRGKVVAAMNVSNLGAYVVAGLGGFLVLDIAPAQAFFGLAIALNAAPVAVASFWLRETAPAVDRPSLRPRGPAWRALVTPQVLTWAGIVLLAALGMGLAGPVARPYVKEVLGMEMRELVPYLILPAALAVASIMPAGHLADRLGRLRPLSLGLGLGAIGMLGVSMTASIWALMGMAALIMLSFTVSVPAMGAALMDLTQEETRGFVLGALGTVGGLGGALGPTVGGLIYQSLTPQDVFLAGGLVLAGAMALAMAYGGWRRLTYAPAPVMVED